MIKWRNSEQTPDLQLPVRLPELELDELWSFVEKKKTPGWRFYAFAPKSKQVKALFASQKSPSS